MECNLTTLTKIKNIWSLQPSNHILAQRKTLSFYLLYLYIYIKYVWYFTYIYIYIHCRGNTWGKDTFIGNDWVNCDISISQNIVQSSKKKKKRKRLQKVTSWFKEISIRYCKPRFSEVCIKWSSYFCQIKDKN